MVPFRTLSSHTFLAVRARLAFKITVLGHSAGFVSHVLMVFRLSAKCAIFANLGRGEISINMTLLLHAFRTVEPIRTLFHIVDRLELSWI